MLFHELRNGQSVEELPIEAYRSDVKGDRYIYLIGGVHGDEVEGVFVLSQLFAALKEDTSIELPLIVVPIVNVDGYRSGTRTNAHGVDLNRNLSTDSWTADFKEKQFNPGSAPLSEPENKYLVKLFEKFPPKFMLSFHTYKPMINYNGDSKKVAEFLHNYNGYEIVPDIGYPTPGSMGDYLPQKYQAPVITFECPKISEEKNLKEIWEENKEGLLALLRSNLLT